MRPFGSAVELAQQAARLAILAGDDGCINFRLCIVVLAAEAPLGPIGMGPGCQFPSLDPLLLQQVIFPGGLVMFPLCGLPVELSLFAGEAVATGECPGRRGCQPDTLLAEFVQQVPVMTDDQPDASKGPEAVDEHQPRPGVNVVGWLVDGEQARLLPQRAANLGSLPFAVAE